MIYREYRPSPALRAIVDRFWWLEGSSEEIGSEPIAPDGHAEIIVHAGDPFHEQRPDGTVHVQDRVLLAGQATRAVRVAARGTARVAGARLRPDGAYRLFGIPQDALTNQIARLHDVHRDLGRRLADDVAGRDEGRATIAVFDRALRQIVPALETSSVAQAALACASQRRGLVRVPELARHAGLGVRHLERLFGQQVGLTPKTYLRILRFQEVLRAVRSGDGRTKWVDLALAHGYYDQAHFIRDCQTFLGDAPGALDIAGDSLTALFGARRHP